MRPDWLNNLPPSWNSAPFGTLFTQSRRKNSLLQRDFVLSVMKDRGVIPYTEKGNVGNKVSEDLSGYKLVDKGDFVLNSMNLYIGSVGVSAYDGVTSTAYIVCKPSEDVYAGYYNYLIQFKGFQEYVGLLGKGIMEIREAVRWTALKSVPVPLPDIATQRRIADFLDRETARIDLLIEKKQRLVVLLMEQLQSKLNAAIFSENATLVPLRRALVAIEQGWSPDCEARSKDNHEWGVLKVGCVNGWFFSSSEHKALPKEFNPRPELEVREGDLLMSRANTPELVGSAAIVKNSEPRLMLCDKLYRLNINSNLLSPEFALLALRTKTARHHYSSRSNGASSSMQNINQETVRTLLVPMPRIEKQIGIVRHFEREKENITQMSRTVNASIDLLKEYRSALITAAVTGQIDVTSWGRRGEADRRLERIELGATE